ncbi:response regulator [Sinorhizobium sp. M4_45]|uniref:response regulator n=1 Tax=Sinorhizobium sp. M4_45 TaxID=2037901 RepID=UPI000C99AF27|nr:response regulator [Sinorhizobium sp. M4_45]PND26779.1 response regulator [Sinorhizobium sp. M4_45]
MESVHVLVAEDEALLLLDFEHALTEAGFVVVTASTGGSATELLNTADPPILGLITDIRFGKPPDGWEVARAAREIDPEIAVVYVSGDSAPDWAIHGVPNSIMLEKPFAMAQLITAISQLLNERSSAAS